MGRALLHEVREWPFAAVGTGSAMSHNQRKRPDMRGPRDVAARSGFASPFQHTVVPGAELVGVVALVGARTGVHEREHAAYQQRGLVVRHRIGAGQDGACLTLLRLAVATEIGVCGRKPVPDGGSLSYMATGERRAVGDMAAGLQDEITGDDQVTHEGRGVRMAAYRAVFQPDDTFQTAARPDFHVADQAAAEYPCALAYLAAVAGLPCGVVRNQPAEVLRQQGIVAVHGLHVRFLCRQAVVNEDVPSSAFAHDMEFRTVPERRGAGHGNGVRMEDDAVWGDVVMGDIPMDVGYQTVVAHGGTVQRGMADTRMERDSARQRDGLLEIPDTVGAGKMHVRQMAKVDIRMDFNQLPVLGRAALLFQLSDFGGKQLPVCCVGMRL